jgi:hypothetical protein
MNKGRQGNLVIFCQGGYCWNYENKLKKSMIKTKVTCSKYLGVYVTIVVCITKKVLEPV